MVFSKDTRDTKDSSHFAKEKLSFHLGRAPLSDLNVVNVAKLWSYEMNRCSALAYNGDVGVIIPCPIETITPGLLFGEYWKFGETE